MSAVSRQQLSANSQLYPLRPLVSPRSRRIVSDPESGRFFLDLTTGSILLRKEGNFVVAPSSRANFLSPLQGAILFLALGFERFFFHRGRSFVWADGNT